MHWQVRPIIFKRFENICFTILIQICFSLLSFTYYKLIYSWPVCIFLLISRFYFADSNPTNTQYWRNPMNNYIIRLWWLFMHPPVTCMCSVDSRRCRSLYLQNRWSKSLVMLYVGHYLPDHEMYRFWSRFSNFHKNGGNFQFLNALSHEPLVQMTRDCVCMGTYLPGILMKRFWSWFSDFHKKMTATLNLLRHCERVISRITGPNHS